MNERRYLRPVSELRDDAERLADALDRSSMAEHEVAEVALLAAPLIYELIEELAGWRDLFNQHVDVAGRRVRVKVGAVGRVGFEVEPLP